MNKTQTILVVDDTDTNIDILVGLLTSYDIAVATNGKNAIEICNEENIDLILLDIMMPEMDGFEVCTILKQKNKTKGIPIIFITAKTDEDSMEAAYDIGGIDYVTKPFKPKELIARVKTQLRVQSLIQNLEHLASYDSLTNIYNRRKFFEQSSIFFDMKDKVFVIMIDIDNFKSINDKYGHPFGDKILKKVTKSISKELKDGDIFGRLGGEEFAIICEEKTMIIIKNKAENIRYAVESIEVVANNGDSVNITISSGISSKNNANTNLDNLLQEADNALYEAKKNGRNRNVFRV